MELNIVRHIQHLAPHHTVIKPIIERRHYMSSYSKGDLGRVLKDAVLVVEATEEGVAYRLALTKRHTESFSTAKQLLNNFQQIAIQANDQSQQVELMFCAEDLLPFEHETDDWAYTKRCLTVKQRRPTHTGVGYGEVNLHPAKVAYSPGMSDPSIVKHMVRTMKVFVGPGEDGQVVARLAWNYEQPLGRFLLKHPDLKLTFRVFHDGRLYIATFKQLTKQTVILNHRGVTYCMTALVVPSLMGRKP